MTETTLLRDAVFNAYVNAKRKRGKPFRQLWKKSTNKEKDREKEKEDKQIIKEIEEKEKKKRETLLEKIYKSAGIERKRKR